AVERMPGLGESAQIEVTLTPGVLPLPAPEIRGAAVEQLPGSTDIVAEALAECEVDAADVVMAPQLLGPQLGADPEQGGCGEAANKDQRQGANQAGDRFVPPCPAPEPLCRADSPRPDRSVLHEPLQVLPQRRGRRIAPARVLVERLEDD